MYGYIGSETIYAIRLFLVVYILPSLPILPILFLVIVSIGIIVGEVVLVLADRHLLL